MRKPERWLLVIVAWLGLGASCGETNMEAIQRLRPRGATQRERLAQVARVLPPPGGLTSMQRPAAPFSPRLVLDYEGKQSTADVLMESQLRDPDRDMSGELDLMLSPELLSCLMWTGPKNPLDESVWDDATELGPDCERAFGARWLVVVRRARDELPERIVLEVFVVDLERPAVVAGFPVAARGRYKRQDLGRGPWAGEAARQLRSDAFEVLRCEVTRRLDDLPGTTIGFEQTRALPGLNNPCARLPKTFVIESNAAFEPLKPER